MAKRKKRYFKIHPKNKPRKQSTIILDQFSIKDIENWNQLKVSIQKFHWDCYSELAFQRAKIVDKIKASLCDNTIKGFNFKQWQRIMPVQYSTIPFSARGSILRSGGRFNFSNCDPMNFSPFPAIYLAKNRKTAEQEFFSQNFNKQSPLTPYEFALSKKESFSCYAINGNLGTIIDITSGDSLKDFVNLIKNFRLSDHLFETAKKIGIPSPETIKSSNKLIEALQIENWRNWPVQFNVPASSQIFGRIILEAGIEGILYQSKFDMENCLAIFPQNFSKEHNSYLKLHDLPPKEVKTTQLDKKNWKEIFK